MILLQQPIYNTKISLAFRVKVINFRIFDKTTGNKAYLRRPSSSLYPMKAMPLIDA